ncbi:MAG: hypothetical protein IKU65_05040 [Oscillospiraceae bacterium]|nr:hypothetical protein [Oscillospiraceae bacterium]
MKKSIYSITLLDELVREVDRAAYLSGTTRSGLINRILAEHLGFSTPETRKRNIFSEMARLLAADENFLINSGREDSLFAVKSSICFKYNPTIRYAVSVYPEPGEFFGELRAQLRTQNARLIAEFDSFFSLWQRLEDAYFGRRLSSFGDGRFSRRFLTPRESADAETLGNLASSYIKALHAAVSAHFKFYPDVRTSAEHISRIFSDYVNSNKEII